MSEGERCYVCERIDTNQFYAELRDLGFTAEDTRQVIGWISSVYSRNPFLLCGRKRATIKAAFAYVSARMFQYTYGPINLSRHWHASIPSMRRLHSEIIATLDLPLSLHANRGHPVWHEECKATETESVPSEPSPPEIVWRTLSEPEVTALLEKGPIFATRLM